MTADKNRRVGRWGEETAAQYLVTKGYQVLDRNIRTPYGELDILAREGSQLVFVEVKTRTSPSLATPEAAVIPTNQQHMLAAIQHYLQQHPEIDADWRVDVLAVRRIPGRIDTEVVHFQNAFS